MPRGNPNPSPDTRIGGPRGPQPGKRAGQRSMEIANAEAATRIRTKLLEELELSLEGAEGARALAEIRADVLKLLKDSEDRGLGSARQAIDHTSSDGSMKPTVIKLVGPSDE
ncbi:terminase small subunit [Paracoccus phage vB_PmaP_KLEP18-1]|nr:terminase small subunit [Paracoccus phage vB_PmaP_KLEP18-1]